MKPFHKFVVCFLLLALASFTLSGCSTETSGKHPIPDNPEIDAVGFDLDDTLIFSSPAFDRGYEKAEQPFSAEFWKIVNASDEARSCIKTPVVNILEQHREAGHEIYVITARDRYNADILKDYVSRTFSIPEDHVYLEPDGKTERLAKLGIDVYYGDSDSDITDAQAADITAIRIQRHPESGYQKKYEPGKFGEKVFESTTEHSCPQ